MKKDLAQLRGQIDEVDSRLVELFERRMAISLKIGEAKRAEGLPIEDHEREKSIIAKHCDTLSNKELIPYWTKLYKTLIELSKEYQCSSNADSPSQSR